MLADDGLKGFDDGERDNGLGVLADELQEKLHAIARVGLLGVGREGEAAGVGATTLDVIEAEQGPTRFGNQRVELERGEPGLLGSIVMIESRVGFAFVETHDGQRGAVARLDAAKVIECDTRLLIGPREGDLGHEDIGLSALGVIEEIEGKLAFGFIKLLGGEEGVEASEARGGTGPERPGQGHGAQDEAYRQCRGQREPSTEPGGAHRPGSRSRLADV